MCASIQKQACFHKSHAGTFNNNPTKNAMQCVRRLVRTLSILSKFDCCNEICYRLKHEESLRKHLKRHQDTFANCPICAKVLQNKHSLGNHIRSVHGERSHQCTMCDKAFKKAIVLKVKITTNSELQVAHMT